VPHGCTFWTAPGPHATACGWPLLPHHRRHPLLSSCSLPTLLPYRSQTPIQQQHAELFSTSGLGERRW
jgi:hypothetical protein